MTREENEERLRRNQKAYREAHREQLRLAQKAYREARRETLRAKQKVYAQAHPEKLKAYRAAYAIINKGLIAEKGSAYYKASKPQRFAYDLLRNYGLSVEEYARMYEAQHHKCAVCGDGLDMRKNTHVDHDHATGAVRGLLCHGCNNALGGARDSAEVLRRLATYLERPR